ncbi:hypothetical protein PTKIN_Ptkin01aG0015100 [Pterospermum kingtungense]
MATPGLYSSHGSPITQIYEMFVLVMGLMFLFTMLLSLGVCGLVGINSGTSQRAYMSMTMRDVISATTRLNLVGPLGAAVLQHQIASVAEAMIQKWRDRPVEDACQTSPLLDTIQGCHGYLFSRLFCS